MLKTGLSYRHPMAVWIDGGPPMVDFLEISAEVFVRPEMANRLAMLSRAWPLALRSTSLSLATPGPLPESLLQPLADHARSCSALWISEPIGFCRTTEAALPVECPAIPNEETVAVISEHAKLLAAHCGCPLLLETFPSPLKFGDPLNEPRFLNRLCEQSGCRLLIDLAGLHADGLNHGFDADRWLADLDPAAIARFRLSGGTQDGNRCKSGQSAAIHTEIWELARRALSRSPEAGAIITHDAHIPAVDALEAELDTLRTLAEAA